MNLAIGNVVMRNRVWEIPLSKLVIKTIERIADNQGISLLKLTGRYKLRSTLTTWTLGVIHRDTNYSNKDNKEYSNKDNEYDIKYNGMIEQGEIDNLFANN